MRVLAVDHGEKRIGLAISDPTGRLARPLTVFEHESRAADARRVNEAAVEHEVGLIVIGQSFDEEGRPNAAGRRVGRFAEALASVSAVPIVLWDESMSTQDARAVRLASGASRKQRGAPVDAEAAAMILASYLEAHRSPAIEAGAPPAADQGEN